jgi:murein DD-endopeptidase MepM/ murein hydrolase activator NlpD
MFGLPLNGSVFPLPFTPSQTYLEGSLAFGAPRRGDGGKQAHSACDLAAPAGTPIFSVDDGTVVRGPAGAFYVDPPSNSSQKPIPTYDLIVRYEFAVVRYCEIDKTLAPGVHKGARVVKGQHIATVSKQNTGTELHFEMYENTNDLSPLDVKEPKEYLYVPNKYYHRRLDLLDPTLFLALTQVKS